MDKITEVPEIDEFLAGPLVTWFVSCLEMVTDEKVTYDNLVNGYLIHNVFLQMNLQVHDSNVYPSTVDSEAWRSRNLLAVLNNIRHFYEDELGQVILHLPDVENLGREPEHNVREIEVLLGLLLGCAVQCPKKKAYIEKIRELDETSQYAVAKCITEVIEVPGITISADMLVDLSNAQKIIECVRKICNDRDEYKAQLRHLQKNVEEHSGEVACENSKLKLKVTSLAEQLDEKIEELEDSRAELREYEKKLRDLTKIHEKLVLEAKDIIYYKDKLDEVNATTEKAERLEQDIVRYQKKLADFDILKARLKELEKSNENLAKDKAALQKYISSQKVEREKMRDLKKQVTKLTEKVSNLTAENNENRDKYLTVCEEKKELQRLVNEPYKQSHVNHRPEGIPSLKDDLLLNQANSKITKLQADNQSLTSYIETLKQTLFQKSDTISTLTRENKKLSHIVSKQNIELDSVKENFNQEVNRSKSLQRVCNEALSKAGKLHQQELELLRSLLEDKQKRLSNSDKDVPNISTSTNKSFVAPEVQGQQKKNFNLTKAFVKCNVPISS